MVFGLEIGVEAGSGEGWYVERLADICAAAPNEVPVFPLAGLARDGSEAGNGGGLLVFEGSQFRHGGDGLVGGECAQAVEAGQVRVAPREHGSAAMVLAISASSAAMPRRH